MRLKSLEIKGFKSFADKTTVNFDEGITGIIGPNGCGKSNIIDSIRWVIGEQKISALRSENLEALVFNGSKSRSASGLAEVSLTFENTKNLLPTEFSTVTVTRRFFKNGDSEYRLNDVSCRLRDIHNLFMDTGVSNDSYAIIELGMVDDIIKDKDNSRRRMLEQAAGITIYKTRKKEAKNKLDLTEQDLARIEDLLFEINNQVKTLESQAKKAEKYFEIKKEYKKISIELAKAGFEGFNETYKNLTAQQQNELDKKIQLEAEIATHEAAIEQEKLDFIEKEKALQLLQQEFNQLQQTILGKENEKNLAAQKLQYSKEKENNLKEFSKKAAGQLNTIKDSILFSQKQLDEEEIFLEQLQSSFNISRKAVDETRISFDEKRNVIDAIRNQFQQIQRKQFDAEKMVAVADTFIQNLERSAEQINEEKNNRIQQLKEASDNLIDKEKLLEEKKSTLQQLQQTHETTKEQIFQTQAQLELLRNELAEENRKLDSKKNEHALLKSLIDSMEGYPESLKFLHKNTSWAFRSPILSDIIYVQEAYRTAVENVLEPYLNYYVVNNFEEGLQALQLLDTNKKGKANFFMLDKLNDWKNNSHQPAGTIKVLDIVEVDDKYFKLVEYLLGNVFIAENDEAIYNSNGAIVLEKNGKFAKGKYTLSGGSIGLFEGKKIGRAKTLEKLQDEIILQEAVINSLKIEIQKSHNQVIAFNEQLKEKVIAQTQNEINELNNNVFAIKNRIETLHAVQSNADKRLQEIDLKLKTEQNNIASSRDLLKQLNNDLHECSSSMKIVEQEYQFAESKYNEASAAFNESNMQVIRQQNKTGGLKQELIFKQNQLNELHNQIEINAKQLNETIESISISETYLADIANILLQILRDKNDQEKKLHEADQTYYNLRNALQDKENLLRTKTRAKEQIEHSFADIKDQLNDLKLQLAGMKERLMVEFKVELDAIIDEPRTTETPLEELQESSDKMKKRLENIGEINPTAIEAFTEMKKRYDFIVEQRNDLNAAKESLQQTIHEVEATANEQFLNTFNKVRENFQKVFKALFTEEDTADMIMENPENLAETGIDIIAKPKGKRPSSINQLSGGEKTLTATALLFAIYLIKPAPFCILDEVDAPLDDVNIAKFTNMIKQFSENSQFIIVTHNKQTMSAVDVIYGVTMQEAGVSKLVPVDFRSLN